MFAGRVASLFLFSLTFTAVSGTPTPKDAVTPALVKRVGTSSDVQAVFTTLKTSTDSILPQIDSLVSGGTATDATVTPLIRQLTSALDTATSSLTGIQGPVSTNGGPSEDEIAALVAGIVSEIAKTLSGLQGLSAVIPSLGPLLAGVNFSLNQVLLGLGILLDGVLTLVATLLASVAGLLRSLGLGLLLGSLGL
ncbi:hypothetical protein FPV67DRAFT_337241 [Lyophyllum atratum]|nr:hypothetical protein FPV67DRAFT_337241 [Lyophyllum atratum]